MPEKSRKGWAPGDLRGGAGVGQGEAGKVKEGWPLLVELWEGGLKKVLGKTFGQIIGQCLSRGHWLIWAAGRASHSLRGNFGCG